MENEFERILFEAGLNFSNRATPDPERQLAKIKRKHSARMRFGIAAAAAAVAIALLVPFVWDSRSGMNYALPDVSSNGAEAYITDDNGNTIVLSGPAQDVEYAEVIDRNSLRYGSSQIEAPQHTHTLTVPRGAKDFTLMLGDGSVVRVNSGSSIKYPANFGGEQRQVEVIYGEAYFSVARDTLRPFVVETALGQTRVLGTKFNVQAFGSGHCDVTLVEGSVAVKQPAQEWSQGRVLTPGENAAVTPEGITVEEVDLQEYVAWIEGYYHYDRKSVMEILQSIANRYDYTIDGWNDNGSDIRFWFGKDEEMEQVIRRLGWVSDTDIAVEGKRIVVK